jgi:hypothetical protein
LTILPAAERSAEIPAEDDLYGRFVGSWDLDLQIHDKAGRIHQSRGEAHAAWVLEGRAIQGIFINPRRSDRGPSEPRGSRG